MDSVYTIVDNLHDRITALEGKMDVGEGLGSRLSLGTTLGARGSHPHTGVIRELDQRALTLVMNPSGSDYNINQKRLELYMLNNWDRIRPTSFESDLKAYYDRSEDVSPLHVAAKAVILTLFQLNYDKILEMEYTVHDMIARVERGIAEDERAHRSAAVNRDLHHMLVNSLRGVRDSAGR
jgi:hypothetical protein